MRRETENTLLLIIGIALVMVTVTGAYTRYVKPGMLLWLAISAAVVIGLSLVAIVRDIRSGGAHAEHDHGHGHAHRNGIVWLLVLPVVLLIFVVPPALSATAASPVTVSAARSFPPLPGGPTPTVSLPELLMRVAVGKVGGLDGRQVTTTGFTMRDGDRVDLAKIVIICCAADAQLARLHLSGPAAAGAAAFPENTWLRVQGTVPAGQTYSGTSSIPTLEVTSVTKIDPPANTYG